MSAIAELFRPGVSASSPGPLDDFWYGPIGYATDSGEKVSSETAMRIATVFACVRVYAETIASLPLFVYKRRKSGGKDKATDHWLYNIVHNQPNPKQTSFAWREMSQGHLSLRGNTYSYIDWNKRGRAELIPIHPDKVTPRIMSDDSIQYEIRDKNGTSQMYLADEILHINELSLNGIVGLNPIEYMAQSLGLSMAAEKFGARFFKNGAKASGVVSYPNALSIEGQGNLRESIKKHIGGENIHSPLILEEDAKWTQLSVNAKDAQFLDIRKYQDIDICKIFRMPPHLIGILDKATYSNIEQQNLEFAIYSVRPKLVRWEQAINNKLLDDDYFVEFSIEGLLRGDIKTRTEALAIQKSHGVLSKNEWRELDNRNPVEGGDELTEYANLVGNNEPSGGSKSNSPDNKVFLAVSNDVSSRLANSEIKTISRRIEKAFEDRDKFNKWVKDFYSKQSLYIIKSISLLSSLADNDGSRAVLQIIESGCRWFENADDAAKVFEVFCREREQQIKDILREVYKNEILSNVN